MIGYLAIPRDWGMMRFFADARPDWSVPILQVLSLPGELLVVLAALLVLLVRELHLVMTGRGPRDMSRAWVITALVLGGLATVPLFESIAGMPRPPEQYHAIVPSPHGFPSGHTIAATVTWGAIGWWHVPDLRDMRLWGVVGLVIVVATSRIGLGVHYVPDVLVAITIGVTYLALAGRIVANAPARGFAVSFVIAFIAIVVSGGTVRATIALGGIVLAIGLWYVTTIVQTRYVERNAHDAATQ